MRVDTEAALASKAMEVFTELLSNNSEVIKAKTARDVMDLRYLVVDLWYRGRSNLECIFCHVNI